MRGVVLVCAWIVAAGGLGGFLAHRLLAGDRTLFLPDITSAGHYQIEQRCELCHTPMQGVKQAACLACHADELDVADDSHPPAKFTDPRNAERVASLDARRCVTCHIEHRPEITDHTGATQPRDFCVNCHFDIAEERPSHDGFPFAGCRAIGCHNFHDNRALTEDHLRAHLDEPDLLGVPDLPASETRSHEAAGVDCDDCHAAAGPWSDAVAREVCATCHTAEHDSFVSGRHGMRTAAGLSPMSPARARLPMRADAADRELDCASCHFAHDYDTRFAAVGACLACHADDHSLAYEASPHAAADVTCATCHLPRVDGAVVHNQNATLRPRSKQLRPVCQRCHGLGYAIDALADETLIDDNFAGAPSRHVQSLDLVRAKRGELP
jgi:hypothetical protein